MFKDIPTERPDTPILDTIENPKHLRALDKKLLPKLAHELRAFLLYCVGQSGGHLAGNLGTVELTIALHYLYNTPEEKLFWDVGHQAYPHKILTGRKDRMLTIRHKGGLSGFLRREESPYDSFGAGHSSTSISAALGMALAVKQLKQQRKVVAIIGDGGITAGMAYEAMAHAGDTRADMLIVLNDNQMSISRNIGGLHNYLSRIWASKLYSSFREGSKKILIRMPTAWELARRTEEHAKGMVAPGTLFEELGLNYIGPIDGHNLPLLLKTIGNLRERKGPHLLHILTTKGKGYTTAENQPISYHAITKINPIKKSKEKNAPKYQEIFGRWLCTQAKKDAKLVAITPAMCEGSGMVEYAKKFPQRFFDVAIAEQHAVTLGAGLSCGGLKPVVAIYSTFLQRAYDQVIHDVALQNLDVLFALDRAGPVGEDGGTHAGLFDLSYLRCIPNMIVMAPSDADEILRLLNTGYQYRGPAAVRYPRGGATHDPENRDYEPVAMGKASLRRNGKKNALLVFGTPLSAALEAAEETNATVVDMRFVKPLDEELILKMANTHQHLITIEENVIAGGAGAAVAEFLNKENCQVKITHLGIPDEFIEHATREEQLADCGLDKAGILKSIL